MPLISPNDTWTLLALMVAGTTVSIGLEQRYRWGARLSAPVIALLIAMTLSNTRLLPADAPAYDFVGTWLVPLALPLLLFHADFRQIARATGRLLISFHVAVVGTLLGAILAWRLLESITPQPAIAAGIMAASYIGGMVNFLAVSESTRAPSSLTTALIVADNFVMAGFFLIILGIVGSRFFLKRYSHPHTDLAEGDVSAAPGAGAAAEGPHRSLSPLDIGWCLTVASGVVALAMLAKGALESAWPADPAAPWFANTLRDLATNRFVLITAVSLTVATLLARPLARLRGASELGGFLLYLFLFSIGLPADLKTVFTTGPALFLFCSVIAVVNVLVTLVVGRLLRLPIEELMLGVNATLGGPPTAAAMAMSKGWSQLILPGLLVGLWGYCIGTPLGLLITHLLQP